jgi:cyclase
MTPVRVMARLDIKGPNVVKGIHLEGLRVVGKPNELARRYYEEGADEILFIDIVASLYGRNNILHIVEEAARDVFIPMTVGGGIRSVDDIMRVLRSGADKVAVNTAAVRQPKLLREAATAFGSQCIVLSVEAKRQTPGRWEVYTDNGRERSGLDVLDWVSEAEQLGVGEVLVTSVDQEGTRAGLDLDLIEAVANRVSIPVIACGGVGSVAHVIDVVERIGIDAVACASVFHYGLCSIPEMKRALTGKGVPVRP